MAELSLTDDTSSSLTGVFLTEEDHENIDSLVHALSEDSYTEIVRDSQQKVTEVNISTSLGGTDVRQIEITRDSNGKVIQTVEQQFDGSGTLIQTLTTDITRDGTGKVTSIDTTEVP